MCAEFAFAEYFTKKIAKVLAEVVEITVKTPHLTVLYVPSFRT